MSNYAPSAHSFIVLKKHRVDCPPAIVKMFRIYLQFTHFFMLLFTMNMWSIAFGEDYVRHDISAVSSFRGVRPNNGIQRTNMIHFVDEMWGFSRKGVAFKRFELERISAAGTYVCTNLPSSEMSEWEDARAMYMILATNGPSRLILEDENGKYMFAAGSEDCYWNENSIFFGPQNNGLCFYFQRGFHCLYTIFSPFGLQERMRFDRVDKSFDLPQIRTSTKSLCTGAVFTNYFTSIP